MTTRESSETLAVSAVIGQGTPDSTTEVSTDGRSAQADDLSTDVHRVASALDAALAAAIEEHLEADS